jgi:hypothetical protein
MNLLRHLCYAGLLTRSLHLIVKLSCSSICTEIWAMAAAAAISDSFMYYRDARLASVRQQHEWVCIEVTSGVPYFVTQPRCRPETSWRHAERGTDASHRSQCGQW